MSGFPQNFQNGSVKKIALNYIGNAPIGTSVKGEVYFGKKNETRQYALDTQL